MNFSGFLNALCFWDVIIPGDELSFPGGEKISLLKSLALEQECVCSLYRKQLSVSAFVRPQGPGLHFIKLGVGGGGGRRYRKKSSPCNAVFSSAHSNTSCLHDSLAETAKHAIGPEGRGSARPKTIQKRWLGASKGRGQDPATEQIKRHFLFLFFCENDIPKSLFLENSSIPPDLPSKGRCG